MRLFEVDSGAANTVFSVLRGMANSADQPSEIPFSAVVNMLAPYGLGISTPSGLAALKNQIDPDGEIIKDVLDDGTVILNTSNGSDRVEPVDTGRGGSSVDSMASKNLDVTSRV